MKRMNVALALLLGTALAGPGLSNAQMSTNTQSNQSSGAIGSAGDNAGAFHIDRFEKRGRKIYAVGWFMGQVNDQTSAYFSPGSWMGNQGSTSGSSMNNGSMSGSSMNGSSSSWSSGTNASGSNMNGSNYAGDMGSSWSNDTLGWGASDTLGLSSRWDTTGNAYGNQMGSTTPGWTGSGVSGSSSLGYNAGGSTGINGSYGSSYSTYGNGATQLGMGSSVGTPSSRDAGNVDALSSSTTTTGGSTDLRTSGGIGANGDMLGDTLGLGLRGSTDIYGYGPDTAMGYGYSSQMSNGTNYDTTVDYSAAVNPVGSGTVAASGDLNTNWSPGDTVFNENLIGPNPTIAASGSLGAGYDVTPGSVVTGGNAMQGSTSAQGNAALQGSAGVSGSVSANSNAGTLGSYGTNGSYGTSGGSGVIGSNSMSSGSGMSSSYGANGSLGMNSGVSSSVNSGTSSSMASGTFYGDTAGMASQGTSMRISTISETALPVTFLGASCETISMQLGAANSGFVHVGNPSRLAEAVGGPITIELKPSTVYDQGVDVRLSDPSSPVVATYVSDVSGNTSLCEVAKLINGDAARTAIVDKLNQLIGAPITGPVRNGIAK